MKNHTWRASGSAGSVTAPASAGRRQRLHTPAAREGSTSGPTNAPIHVSPVVIAGRTTRGEPGCTVTRSSRSLLAASLTATVGPPYGQPLPSVRSSLRPSARAWVAALPIRSRNWSERNGAFDEPAFAVIERQRVDGLHFDAADAPFLHRAEVACDLRRRQSHCQTTTIASSRARRRAASGTSGGRPRRGLAPAALPRLRAPAR